MHVATLLIALAAVSPAAAAIRGHRDPPTLGDEGSEMVGACLINWEATKNGNGYESDTHGMTPASDGSYGKKGFACDDPNGQYAVMDSIRDLFGPVTSWPYDCESSHGNPLGAWRDTSTGSYQVHHDCSCTMQPVTLNAQCTLNTAACIKFATVDDVSNSVPSFKAYAFPTDQKTCVGMYPESCGLSCADTSGGSWYDATDAVTAAVTTLLTYNRPDLAPACMNGALDAKAHPERFRAQTPEWHAIVDMLVEQHDGDAPAN